MAEPMVAQDAVAFYMLSELVRKDVKVILSGQGADEGVDLQEDEPGGYSEPHPGQLHHAPRVLRRQPFHAPPEPEVPREVGP